MTGTSAKENLGDVRKFIENLAEGKEDGLTIMDVGAGQGTYWHALHTVPGVVMEAIEVWGPSIEQFKLNEKYAFVWTTDVRKLPPWSYLQTDVVIFGDVLEHMTVDEAVSVFSDAYECGAYVIVSVPNSPYPQGAIDGNHYEEHIILDPVVELMPHLPEPVLRMDYPVTSMFIYKKGASSEAEE